MDDKEFLEKIRDTFEKDKIKLADKKEMRNIWELQ